MLRMAGVRPESVPLSVALDALDEVDDLLSRISGDEVSSATPGASDVSSPPTPQTYLSHFASLVTTQPSMDIIMTLVVVMVTATALLVTTWPKKTTR